MSYEEFRKRIDTARQILVGAVPSPAGQIDQITYALMYKFMNDIDDESVSYGGKRQYFTGEYEKFNWHNLMAPSLEAYDRLELYRQAIQGMAKNPNIPELFREIYQNAFLPFNSPNVLTLFLNEINKFSHGDSDDIGDAYEYLLSITGAQGDVGQFRTPRHIIKFIVEAVNPTKTDKVLDPAVGTAGFLIAAYNHVKTQHDGKHNLAPLTADDKTKLHKNYRGYDIDPTMVRTASVNMYLHGFAKPDIRNHDTLSSTDYWDERFDVILANPPFMTPKGGIQPHKKFSIKANRAEVLFVDYIANHLNPVSGRAGIVVPEGIIFQSGKAYKELRKKLVEEYLYAVVSLPAGVFQPYSGVKTSVLLFDRELAKKKQDILFVKVENDGFSLGAQRRAVSGDQLPEALETIKKYQAGEEITSSIAHSVAKTDIAESGDYNLSGDRYRTDECYESRWTTVSLGEVANVINGSTPLKSKKKYWENGSVPWFTIDDIRNNGRIVSRTSKCITDLALTETSIRLVPAQAVLLCCTASIGEYAITNIPLTTNQQFNALVVRDNNTILPKFLFWMASNLKQELNRLSGKTSFGFVSGKTLKSVKIPLPPLEIQRQIVAELDGYQKIIDAANAIVQSYKPTIKINPSWESVELGDVTKYIRGVTYSKKDEVASDGLVVLRANNLMLNGDINTDDIKYISREVKVKSDQKLLSGDVFICAASGSKAHIGKVAYITKDTNYYFGGFMAKITTNSSLDSRFLYFMLRDDKFNSYLDSAISGVNINNLNSKIFYGYKIPLPPLDIQRQIVAKLEAEQELINANKKLIDIYTQKIKTKLVEIWGE